MDHDATSNSIIDAVYQALQLPAKTIFQLLNAHPFLGAASLALSLRIVIFLIAGADFKGSIALDIARTALFVTIMFGGLTCCCWPVRRYSIVLWTVLIFCSLSTLAWVLSGSDPNLSRSSSWLPFRYPYRYFTLRYSVVIALPLLIAVFVRNRFWPVYLAGHCRECQYNLTGNVSGICPECGTPVPLPDDKAPRRMFCRGCGYSLFGLTSHRCPECRRPFDPNDASTFDKDAPRPKRWPVWLCVALAVIPIVAVLSIYLTWLAGRFELGHWPSYLIDDPKSIGGLVDVFHPIAFILCILFMFPLHLVASWCFGYHGSDRMGVGLLITIGVCLGISYVYRRSLPRRFWRVLVMTAVSWCGSYLFLWWDPLRVVKWFWWYLD